MTSAIYAILKVAGVKSGDEVMCSSFNCLSSTAAISMIGAKPVWIDLSDTYPAMSLEDCKKKVTSKTKAILLYHIAGYPSYSKKFQSLCDKNNLILIDDINNAFGATYDGRLAGSNGDFSVTSFYPNRQISSIEGAVVTIKNKKYLNKIKRLKKYGIDSQTYRDEIGEINPQSDIEQLSFNSALSNVHAYLANESLADLEERLSRVRSNAMLYDNKLKKISAIQLFDINKIINPVYWTYLIKSDESIGLIKFLKKNNIHASKLHYLNHKYSGFGGSSELNSLLPNTHDFFNKIVCLPCGWWLGDDQIDRVAVTIKKYSSK
jgi:dTDP-4-amino-4,6-dideoxygalactose transaminase